MAGGSTFDDAAKAMLDMSKRLARLDPALKVIAEEIGERTDSSFAKSASPLGSAFAALATSTLIERARKRSPAARKKQKNAPHRLTKGAKAKRVGFVLAYHNQIQGFGGVTATPLIDTGRMRKSQRTLVKSNAIEWSAVGYMGPHMTGGKNLPKRNPTVFELSAGQWKMIPAMHSYVVANVSRYVRTGKLVA